MNKKNCFPITIILQLLTPTMWQELYLKDTGKEINSYNLVSQNPRVIYTNIYAIGTQYHQSVVF